MDNETLEAARALIEYVKTSEEQNYEECKEEGQDVTDHAFALAVKLEEYLDAE